jgi:hypothetical protein
MVVVNDKFGDERYLGERRCSSGQLYCRALGLGGQSEDCDHIILLVDRHELSSR